ncbi:hypothetical protein HBI56_217210 [Parastagonospora nodorum]|uniref:Uncharacterized protein n=1 Tax=Phaeosphaeria nodorum (strain SN15 / ATCC MYA-4574 / FGSC 10173) TaxID=321614 RepID=A0A7U2F272_PHANO|nr:hypothetical protein HBH56_175420 [Parastagonospora nodorum]QRC96273.1 hypothetical protein JI435_408570 [Parastagonospora nodorum SN15]KAH3926359.1 hypothetical protein HBH54_167740 [Parastagonospora nodorum]KAH3955599.1 hypothetical protein HBH53_000560 [Parastagonospora nodorum]KAH3965690.1 hypothetical protein HBH52_204400 [Parastagonospora nodorum]
MTFPSTSDSHASNSAHSSGAQQAIFGHVLYIICFYTPMPLSLSPSFSLSPTLRKTTPCYMRIVGIIRQTKNCICYAN